MKKADLLNLLAETAARLGVEPPSQSKLESWISKGLIRGATAKGVQRGVAPEWSFSSDTVLAAVKLVELEARGAKRVAQLRIGLAIAGFDTDPQKLRDNTISEANRSLKRMRRNGWRNFSPRSQTDKPSARMTKGANRVAPVLRSEQWAMPDQAIYEASVMILAGTSLDRTIPASVIEGARSLLASHFSDILGDEILAALLAVEKLFQFMPGIAGDADDTDRSLQDRLDEASLHDLLGAVTVARTLANATNFEPVFPISNTTKLILETVFSDPNWQALLLGILVVQLPLLKATLGPDFAMFLSDR